MLLLSASVFLTGCLKVRQSSDTPRLLKAEDSSRADMLNEINRFARVGSLRAKMYLKFEDNSFAEFGNKEVYRSADGEIVVQRPAKIYMKVQVPVIHSDVAQMTSDGTSFRVAILKDDGSGKLKKFIKGTNSADYSRLQKRFDSYEIEGGKDVKASVNAMANLRPQHFTDAMLVAPTDKKHSYILSTVYQPEEDMTQQKKSPLRNVIRPYYLLDEIATGEDGVSHITRRFWFDRVGGMRLARLQIFDAKAEIESDIVYGLQGNLTSTGEYNNLPLEIIVTRPKEHYSMRLKYQSPEDVAIGKTYPDKAFLLENSWGLEELDLDKKLADLAAQQNSPSPRSTPLPNSAVRLN
ncbi:MAG: hypothetical protein LC113_02490 [Acidobacteria bacterium]|nr:hypothetical protein [Acidobacteriota bacterium]